MLENLFRRGGRACGTPNLSSIHAPVFESLEARQLLAVDLTAMVADGSTIVAAGISGEANPKAGTIIVDVTNAGDTDLEKSDAVDVQIFARPVGAVDASQDVLLNAKDVFVKGNKLGAGATSTAKVKVMLPATLANGEYDLVAKVDALGQVEESNENNNEAVEDVGLQIADPFVDIAPSINADKSKLADAVVSGAGDKMTLVVDVANNGNTELDKSLTATVTLTAVPTGGGDEVLIGTFENQKIAAKLGKPKSLKLKFTLPPGVETGEYALKVDIQPTNAIPEPGGAQDNTAQTASTIDIQEGFVTVDAQVDPAKTALAPALVSGETDPKGKVAILITNNGNVAIPKGQTATVTLVARPDGGGADVELGTATAKISGAKPGQVKKANIKAPIPGTLPDGDYTVYALITPDQPLPGIGEQMLMVSDLTVAPAFVDITGVMADNPFGIADIEGTTKKVTTTFTNSGNVEAKGTVALQYFASMSGTLDGSEIAVSDVVQDNGSLDPGESTDIDADVTLPSVFDNTVYTIIAKLTVTLDGNPTPIVKTANVGTLTVQATPPEVTDLIGMMTFGPETDVIDLTNNIPGIGRVGQISRTGTLTSTSGLNVGVVYTATYGPGTAEKMGTIQFAPGIATNAGGAAFQTQTVIHMEFKNAGNRPDSLVGMKVTLHTNKPANYVATARLAATIDFINYDVENLYVTIDPA